MNGAAISPEHFFPEWYFSVSGHVSTWFTTFALV
jgi:hypothetical protein